ncbi:iron complex outermembrane recepter protein [Rhodoferax sp. OV413]|uniref:TonB-dependent receptor n=1 Tax=Rhodoferax sp. OV413 TaxID=1855285 RepID=UPI00089130B2|nr:TonB-dependent receptor [Rhodoferax sp. OV413]SDN91066.1 iron complex outermembrane recepter protein [Rhodoferax sp. OV413]
MAQRRNFQPAPVASAVLLTLASIAAHAQSTSDSAGTLSAVQVNASADASAEGLSKPYAGGQVARGGRAGILGTKDNMDTPFSITSYTNELIQDRQAKSVGEVLQNDPTVRMARGFGNFQESYFIRGFLLSSDDVAYNGMYSLLPRQYIATELFERVEVLRGASTFLNGANPGGGGIGGSINLVPKRAPNEPLNRITVGTGSGGANTLSADIARRFGPDNATGIRVNAATRNGGTAVDKEDSQLGLLSAALDWRSRDVRLSGDIGWQENKLKETRTNVDISALASVPAAPDNATNWAQPGAYSNERDLFGTLRGEFDINDHLTAWAALGARRSSEANSLANLVLSDASTGAGSTYRFDNTRKDSVLTTEAGLRGKFQTGSVGHEWVVSAASFKLEKKNAYAMDFGNQQSTNLYNPVATPLPAISAPAFTGNTLASPALTGRTEMTSLALGDTLSLFGGSTLLTLGARHQTLDIDNYDYGTGALSSNYNKSRLSPMAGVVYKLNKQYSLYANYVEGLTQGSTAPSTAVNKGETLSPYISKQKEVGLKWDSGRFGGTLALFDTTRPRDFLNVSNNVFSASGEDRHQGMELTLQGEATRGLRLLGGLTLLSAEQKSTGSATTDGKQVIGVPKRQANLGAEWDVPGVPGLALDGRVVYTGASYADAVNTLKVSGWTRLDAGARYLTEVQGKLVTLRLRVDNLANKSYWASVGGYSGYGYLVAGAPRSVNLSASFDF